MYDEETIFMNRISNLKEFRHLVEEYRLLGINLNDQVSLDNDSLDDFKDGTILADIVSIMDGRKVPSINKEPKSNAS